MSSSGELEDWVGAIRSGVVGLAVAVLTFAAAFFWLISSRLRGCCRFCLGYLGYPGGGHFKLRECGRDRLRRGFRIRWLGSGSLDNTPPLDDVIPSVSQFHLFGRGSGPLSIESGGVARGGVLSDILGRSLCKGRFRLFQLNTAVVVSCGVSPHYWGWVEHPPEMYVSPHATPRGAYS
jgi:hypothetical protein